MEKAMNNPTEIISQIKQIRELSGKTIYSISQISGISRSNLGTAELKGNITLKNLCRLCDALDCRIVIEKEKRS